MLDFIKASRPGQGRHGDARPIRKPDTIPRAVANETFHTNPKRKRGNDLATSLTLRASVVFARSQYKRLSEKSAGPFGPLKPAAQARNASQARWKANSFLARRASMSRQAL